MVWIMSNRGVVVLVLSIVVP